NVSFYNESDGKNITSTPSVGMVGLRKDVYGIPIDRFQVAGQHLYLIRCYGEKLSDISFWFKNIRELVNGGGVTAARAIGKYGPGYALARMSQSGVGADVQLSEPLFEERFYEALLVLENEMEDGVVQKLHAVQIGKTDDSSLKINNIQYDISKLQQLYKKGWNEHFKSLS
ncbi:MAG: hypothetical protein KDD25_05980, partial [Bdellovibrionales bacterium]|nr:hypothetical protein [Bdellovibrionales bacterium]